ncbi:hypothetical protein SAY87_022544 [Trapa incisa]|uniref:CBM20 domain-containing protein n=1 Tax=Trapa incisa TaxID=236973 RepID=A0AAN7K7Z1_9MYRT|nr:hypothetical protein SAY87_022544 [Trapa incisa]
MDAITTYSYCSSKFCAHKCRVPLSRGGSRRAAVPAELLFPKPRKVFDFRILRLAAEKPRRLCPAAASLSSNWRVRSETTERGTDEEADLPKAVHVRFQLKKVCQFGEHILLVGNDPILGSWDPSGAIPMNWSDGNLWTLDLDIPIRRQIGFKFILMGSTGIIQWQPCPDRVLETWETDKAITVYEDWEDAALQRITEEELLKDSSGKLNEKWETLIVADNLSIPMEQAIHKCENGSALSHGVAAPAEVSLENPLNELPVADMKPLLQNKSMSIVAENIAQTGDKIPTDSSSMDPEAPEAEEKQGTVMELFHHEKKLNEKQKEVHQSTRGQERRATEGEQRVNLGLAHTVPRNEFPWGPKTLQSFLANLLGNL